MSGANWIASQFRTDICCSPRATSWRKHTRRSMCVWSPRGRRAARSPRSRPWRAASRSSPPASARRWNSSATARTGSSRTSTTSRASWRPSSVSTTMPGFAVAYAPRGVRRPRLTERSDWTRAGPNCWKGSSMVRAERYARAAWRWLRLLTGRNSPPGLRVFYGHDRVPAPGDAVAGGSAKFQRLAQRFPNHPTDFSLLYLGSTWLPRDAGPLLGLARRRQIPIIVNQSGVAYPGWAGSDTDQLNSDFRRVLLAADHVLYQSEFCKRSADEFLGESHGSWEVLYNAVDVEQFAPAESPDASVLLLAGDQTQAYRLEGALRPLALLPQARPGVAGRRRSGPSRCPRSGRGAAAPRGG